MKTILEFLKPNKVKILKIQQMPHDEFIKLLSENDHSNYIIYVEEYNYDNPSSLRQTNIATYIMAYGDDTIGEQYGKLKFSDDTDINGMWKPQNKNKVSANKVLDNLQEYFKINCSHVRKTGDPFFKVGFCRCGNIPARVTFSKVNIYDCRF